jgi:hypothetical protein
MGVYFNFRNLVAIDRIRPETMRSFLEKSPLEQIVGYQQETYIYRSEAAVEVNEGRFVRIFVGKIHTHFRHKSILEEKIRG